MPERIIIESPIEPVGIRIPIVVWIPVRITEPIGVRIADIIL